MAEPAPHRPPPRPEDEDARLAVLRAYGVLDTDPEQDYDDLVALAAAICGTPKAAISLVDEDRQWFKARLGIDAPETPRDISFCAHAILEPDQLLEVPDATADGRFAGNPLVAAEGGIRFYAGTPLVAADDQPLGALCVIDTQPRRLTGAQRVALAALGRQVVAQLELRRTVRDVAQSESRARASEARYRRLSEHDALTGLLNRSTFHARLAALAGTPVGLCFLDLDGFKQVNDDHGHEAGDIVLRHVADALRDVCADDAVPARLGGDEFVVLSAGADARALRRLAARIEDAVMRPVVVRPGRTVTVGASAGWTVGDGTVEVDELVRRADRAMYDAKSARRRSGAALVDGLAEDLRRAIDTDELVVHYQPFFAVRGTSGGLTARATGLEALVRWQHPQRGLVPPDAFIPAAERTGLIGELGRHVLRRAVEDTATWERAGILPAGFKVHVNLAAQQLHSGGVLSDVVAALADFDLPGERLCLEVTESGLLDVREFTPEAAARFGVLGVELALDDFGTGFSSLTQLRTYPFSVVKVDRSFVSGLGQSKEDEAIVASVVSLAHRLGITPVAEGVESVAQLRRLLKFGCSTAQGFLLARPAPAADVPAVLAAGWMPVAAPTRPAVPLQSSREDRVTAASPAR